MENSQSVVICFMFLHLIGIICVALNAYYLKRTRGYDSARIQLNAPNSDKKRLFKIRNSIACNILIIYHITLTALELGMAIIYQIPQMYNESYTTAYFLLVGINYGILVLLCLPWAFLSGTFKSHAHLGHVHACNAFEFFNLVIHWGSILLVMVCTETNCSDLPSHMGLLGSGFAIIPIMISYVAMLIGAACNYPSFMVYNNMISRQDAVNIIKQKLEEPPYIDWTVSCGQSERFGKHLLILVSITTNDRPFGCPIIYTEIYSQCYFVHWHNASYNQANRGTIFVDNC